MIGEVIKEGLILEEDGKVNTIDPPGSDELYSALSLEK